MEALSWNDLLPFLPSNYLNYHCTTLERLSPWDGPQILLVPFLHLHCQQSPHLISTQQLIWFSAVVFTSLMSFCSCQRCYSKESSGTLSTTVVSQGGETQIPPLHPNLHWIINALIRNSVAFRLVRELLHSSFSSSVSLGYSTSTLFFTFQAMTFLTIPRSPNFCLLLPLLLTHNSVWSRI